MLATARSLRIKARPWDLMLIAGVRAAKRYGPKPSDIRIDFFRAQTGPDDSSTPWERLAGRGVSLHPVIGANISHITILKEQGAATLAREMARVLGERAAEGRAPVTSAGTPAANGAAHASNGAARASNGAGTGGHASGPRSAPPSNGVAHRGRCTRGR